MGKGGEGRERLGAGAGGERNKERGEAKISMMIHAQHEACPSHSKSSLTNDDNAMMIHAQHEACPSHSKSSLTNDDNAQPTFELPGHCGVIPGPLHKAWLDCDLFPPQHHKMRRGCA